MKEKETGPKFVADLAPIGSNAWREHFRNRYGDDSLESVREFLGRDKPRRDAIDEALHVALRSAAELYPDDRIYPDDTWSYNGPDDY